MRILIFGFRSFEFVQDLDIRIQNLDYLALPKKFRLKRKDVRNIFSGSRRLSSAIGTFFLKNNGLLFSRFAFAVPVSVSKKSNIRNRIKRMALGRVRINLFNIIAGLDVVVIFKKEAASFTQKEFYQKLQESFLRIGLLKQHCQCNMNLVPI